MKKFNIKKISKIFAYGFKLLTYNIKPIALFELIYITASSIAVPSIIAVFLWIGKKVTGISYIGNDTILPFLLSPIVLIEILIILYILAYILLFDISALNFAFYESHVNTHVSLSAVINAGIENCKRMFKIKNIPLTLFLVILIPFINVVDFSNSGIAIMVPEFIEDFIFANNILSIVYPLVRIIFFLLSCYYIFSIHYFTLEQEDFLDGCRYSRRLTKGNFIKIVIVLLLCQIIFTSLTVGISSVFGYLITSIEQIFNGHLFRSTIKESIMGQTWSKAFSISNLVQYFITPCLNLSIISSMYYYCRDINNLDETHPIKEVVNEPFDKKEATIIGLVIGFLLCSCVYTYSNIFNSVISTSNRPIIFAHRGSSLTAPENSMAAFKLAIEQNVDGVELDIHETKDGTIIVCHDENLKRITGKNINVYDVTYDELKTMDVGSWFSDEYSYLRISTLDEVLKLFKGTGISLQIEIKPTKYDFELEEKLLQIIEDNEMYDQVIILSLNADSLRRVKQLNPNATTCFCMTIAMGDVTTLDFCDLVSIEEESISIDIVSSLHEVNKKCYVWTVNLPEKIQNLVDCNVDGIVTDDPELIYETLNTSKYKPGIDRIIRLLTD